MKFENKVVLVTGGSRGIGAATVREFAKEGAKVIIHYNRDEEAANSVLEDIGGNGLIVKTDLKKVDEILQMFEVIKDKYGELDILINNAGIVKSNDFMDLTLQDWNDTYAVNTTAVFICSQQALKIMNKGGSVINISSMRGILDQGRPSVIDYSSSKAAVISFTKTLAKEVAPEIRVNCVSPGMARTDKVKAYSDELLNQFKESIYLKRLIEPTEIANSILFLASNEASGITGANLVVDGGQSLG